IGCMLPEFMNSSARSWAGLSVCMERRTQMSSMHWASSGNSSLTSTPLLPCLANLNGDCISLRPLRLVPADAGGAPPRDMAAGRRRAVAGVLGQGGMGAEGGEVARPAVHEQEDDALRPGREVGGLRGERAGGALRLAGQHPGEAEGAEAAPEVGQHLTAGQR